MNAETPTSNHLWPWIALMTDYPVWRRHPDVSTPVRAYIRWVVVVARSLGAAVDAVEDHLVRDPEARHAVGLGHSPRAVDVRPWRDGWPYSDEEEKQIVQCEQENGVPERTDGAVHAVARRRQRYIPKAVQKLRRVG